MSANSLCARSSYNTYLRSRARELPYLSIVKHEFSLWDDVEEFLIQNNNIDIEQSPLLSVLTQSRTPRMHASSCHWPTEQSWEGTRCLWRHLWVAVFDEVIHYTLWHDVTAETIACNDSHIAITSQFFQGADVALLWKLKKVECLC